MRFFIATGTHKPLSEHEIARFVPKEITARFPIICHDCDQTDNLLYLGQTTAGTPVWVNRAFYEADIRIVVGNIEPHHFMGYSGGMKTAAIGLGGRETITKNHAMLAHPKAKMGLYKSNPMRMDVEEIGHLMKVQFAFNIVMDSEKKIVSAFWGEPGAVIRAGIAYYQDHFQMDLDDHLQKYDVVIASPGGYPKDINLYQAQKALTHACLLAKKGATIILAAECRDGYGSRGFEEFLTAHRTAEKIIREFENSDFHIGPHKAYQIALQAKDHKIMLVTEMKETQAIRDLVMTFGNLEEALYTAKSHMPANYKTALLPDATHIIPRMNDL
jgi:nickel-dependent lactate racemase